MDGAKTGFGLSATTNSSISRLGFPAQSARSFSTLWSVRMGARIPATVRLIWFSARAGSSCGKRRQTLATWIRRATEPSLKFKRLVH